jgi:hypothetical protein
MRKSQAVEQGACGPRVGHDRDDGATPAARAVHNVIREHPFE